MEPTTDQDERAWRCEVCEAYTPPASCENCVLYILEAGEEG